MSIKKVFAVIILSMMVLPAFADYQEVECTTQAVFSENSCNQCFTGSEKWEGDHLGFLSDDILNKTDVQKILYKEEQQMPQMINLNPSQVTWSQEPSGEAFWEYTDEFNSLYVEDQEGYVINAGDRVTWLKSKLGYAYKLEKNQAANWENIGLLVYPISSHNILSNGEITHDTEEHRECVIFTSGEASEESSENIAPMKKTEVTRLPQTGPAEFMLLALLAIMLAFGFQRLRKQS